MATLLQARLKPLNPARGHTLQGITLSQLDGKRYSTGMWYLATEAEAEVLRRVRQNHSIAEPDEDLPGPREAAFDVCTREEAHAIEASETRDAMLAGTGAGALMAAPSRDDDNDDAKPAAPVRRVGARK